MKENFSKYILTRALWIALLENGKLNSAINTYKKYIENLSSFYDNESEAEKELKYAENLFINKIIKLSDEYYNNKDYPNALICYKYIYDAHSENIDNLKNYINCLEKLQQFDLQLILAKDYHKKYKNAESYKILSNAYEKNLEYKKAIKYYKKHIELACGGVPNTSDNNTLGCHYFNSYIKKGENPEDAQKALKYFTETIKEAPNNKSYLKNTIVAAMKAKNYKIEKACWETYLKNGYASKDDEFTYCASCMRNGDIKEWAKYYRSRFEKNEPTIYPKLNKPEWTGEQDISNSTLLVHYEQGYGDNFLMFGYMPRLKKIAKHVIYYIQNNAYELLKNNDYGIEIICQKTTPDINKINFDYHIPCMSIPIALNLDKSNISVEGGYLKPDKNLVNIFKEKYFNTPTFKIGLAFEGVSSNNKRDIPIKNLLPLDNLKNIQLYCLSKDIEDKQLKLFKNNKVINIAKNFNNFADTAAAIDNTDIILSSDNCILNLAGAMGKRTIGIFNYHYEFRWYDLTGNDCGWYKSVYPIVNNEYNDWSISIQKAIKIIQKDLNNYA